MIMRYIWVRTLNMDKQSEEEARAIRVRIADLKRKLKQCETEKDKCWRAVRRLIFSGKSDPSRFRFLREKVAQLNSHTEDLEESLDNLPELCFLCDGIGCSLCLETGLEMDTIKRSIGVFVDAEEMSFKKGR